MSTVLSTVLILVLSTVLILAEFLTEIHLFVKYIVISALGAYWRWIFIFQNVFKRWELKRKELITLHMFFKSYVLIIQGLVN